MEMLISGIISSLLMGFLVYNFGFEGIVTTVMYVEKQFTNLGVGGVDFLFRLILGYGVSLIVLKFLKKGFDMYILGVEGDADSDPILLLINFFRAMAIAIGFPIFYDFFVNMLEKESTRIINIIGLHVNFDISNLSNIATQSLLSSVFSLAFVIIFVMTYIKMLGLGAELLVLRVGLPLASAGLMDADNGSFKPYIQKFIQSFFTVLVQILLLKFGMALMFNGHIIWGIVFANSALKTPRFLQEFLITSQGGGGGMNNAYHSIRLTQMARTVFKR